MQVGDDLVREVEVRRAAAVPGLWAVLASYLEDDVSCLVSL